MTPEATALLRRFGGNAGLVAEAYVRGDLSPAEQKHVHHVCPPQVIAQATSNVAIDMINEYLKKLTERVAALEEQVSALAARGGR